MLEWVTAKVGNAPGGDSWEEEDYRPVLVGSRIGRVRSC